jgi:hypothetical protein
VKIEGFGIGPSRDYSMFPCWNHWPVAQLPNDGRKALVSDRPSHFSLSSSVPVIHRKEGSSEAMFLYGMTDQPAETLAPLSRSWNSAPAATLAGSCYEGGAYKKSERAYIFTAKASGAGPLEFTLEATPDSPIHNPAFVVKNWGNRPAKLSMDGKPLPRGKDFRFGHNKTIDGTDLIVWVKTQGNKKTSFKISAPKADDDQVFKPSAKRAGTTAGEFDLTAGGGLRFDPALCGTVQAIGAGRAANDCTEGFGEVEGVAKADFLRDFSHRLIRGIQ